MRRSPTMPGWEKTRRSTRSSSEPLVSLSSTDVPALAPPGRAAETLGCGTCRSRAARTRLAIGSPRERTPTIQRCRRVSGWRGPGLRAGSPAPGSDQFLERLAMVEQVLRAARRIDELRRLGIDPEVLVER